MRKFLLALLLVAASPCYAADDSPLDESTTPQVNLPDPLPDNGTHFSPSAATRDVALPSTGLPSAATRGGAPCNALNPCAAPTPARGGGNQQGDPAASKD